MIRFVLILAALAVAAFLIAAHGVRAIAAIAVLLLAVSVPQTRSWRVSTAWLVRMTGSRRRAAAAIGVAVLGVMVALAIYSLIG